MRLNKRERVKLLAASYPDAVGPDKGETVRNRVHGFKDQRRSMMWEEGSYWELECAIADLGACAPIHARWFRRVYVFRVESIASIAPHKRHRAEQGLSFVVERTAQRAKGNIYVPEEVSLNARNYGWVRDFSESEAHSARRPRERAAA